MRNDLPPLDAIMQAVIAAVRLAQKGEGPKKILDLLPAFKESHGTRLHHARNGSASGARCSTWCRTPEFRWSPNARTLVPARLCTSKPASRRTAS